MDADSQEAANTAKAWRIASLVIAVGSRAAKCLGPPASTAAIASKSRRYAATVCGEGLRVARSARKARNYCGRSSSVRGGGPDGGGSAGGMVHAWLLEFAHVRRLSQLDAGADVLNSCIHSLAGVSHICP